MPADISKRNGRTEAFTALTPAWWDGDGEYMTDEYLTSEEVWGDRGLLNFEYELRAVADAETGRSLADYRHCVRKDTGVTVGCGMKKGYQIVQPKQAFGFLDDLMQDGTMRYASAGVLGRGEEVWILGVIPDAEQPIQGETHRRYVLWTDRFDGGGMLRIFPCATRVECRNTLSIALGERDSSLYKGIRHSGDIQAKLDAARDTLIESEKAFQQYNADCRKLIGAEYTAQDAKSFVETLFPTPKDDASQHSKSIRERKVESVREAFLHPSNGIGEMQGTYWQLVNAVTFAVDHGDVFRFRGEKRTSRFRSLMTSDGARLKRTAFDLALSMAS